MKILFMCVANSARSQIAEGLAQQIFPTAEVKSAGSEPTKLNHYAVIVMKEIGIDISSNYSKSYDDLSPKFLVNLDYVVTLCAEEVCPVIVSRAKKLHWPHPDPAAKEPLQQDEMLNRFRIARDAIRSKLLDFKKELEQ